MLTGAREEFLEVLEASVRLDSTADDRARLSITKPPTCSTRGGRFRCPHRPARGEGAPAGLRGVVDDQAQALAL
jgi:hypothetical protein